MAGASGGSRGSDGSGARNVLHVLASAFRLQLQLSLATPNYISAVFFQPAVMAILTGLIFTFSGRPEYIDYAVVGAGMFGVWNSNLYAAAGILQGERRFGTLEFLVTTRSPLFLVVLGKTLAAAFFSLFSLAVALLVMLVAFGRPLQIADAGLFLLSVAVSIGSITVVGILFSTATMATRYYYRAMDFFYLVFILSGLMFPVDLLPPYVRPLSYALPTTWSIALFRAGLGGIEADRWLFLTAGAMVTTLVYLVAAFALYSRVMRRARAQALFGRF